MSPTYDWATGVTMAEAAPWKNRTTPTTTGEPVRT